MLLLLKNGVKKVWKTAGRFVSLVLIVAVGVAFFAGIRSSSPDIISSIDHYFDGQNLMDFKIISTAGLTEDDITSIKQLSNSLTVIPSYQTDFLVDGKVVRAHALEQEINNPSIVEGRTIENSEECLGSQANYQIGNMISFPATTELSTTSCKIVGLVDSALYMAHDYGITNIGDGKLNSFIFVEKSIFTSTYYSNVFITAQDARESLAYSRNYEEESDTLKEELQKLKPIRETIRYEELQKDLTAQIFQIEAQIKAAPANQVEVLQANLAYVREALNSLEKPTWHLQDRASINGYRNLKDDTDKVAALAIILPVFFMAIVILMALNTLTRMVEEERGEIGILTSLGYSNARIMLMYLSYSITSSLFGITLGFFLGSYAIPKVIYSVYGGTYILPKLILHYDYSLVGIILATSIIGMVIVTIVACLRELKNKPSVLLLPPVPKEGKQIFLEKIKFIWSRMSFTWKITMRNLFRYKKRAFMVLVGVAGCTGILLMGFGVRDSVDAVAKKQYSDIMQYDELISLAREVKRVDSELDTLLSKNGIIDYSLLFQSNFQFEYDDRRLETFIVSPANNDFYNYFKLIDKKTGNQIELSDDGVIITSKMAELLKKEPGDTIEVRDSDDVLYIFKINAVVENYIYHYIYMDKAFYQAAFEKDLAYNTIVSHDNARDRELLASNLMKNDAISFVNFTSDNLNTFESLISGLNQIILMIIGIAAILALVVLYNLTTINISERTREIATLKVLGFFDKEVNDYTYRETIILSTIAILIGLVVGIGLHQLVIRLIELDSTVFIKSIHPLSYLYSALIMAFFTAVISIVSYVKSKRIDMISSLKSVD